jgi:FAD binding domain
VGPVLHDQDGFTLTNNSAYTAFLEPTCVFLPNNTQDVSDAVSLFSENDCTFSIKGGGHSSLPGAANINDGIAIILKNLNQRAIDFDNNLIRVGMGNRLGDVYRTLDPYNLSTLIGRYNDVGLGLAVGAGLSFFGNRDGLTIDNVLNFEVVLANGTVLETSTTEHAGLHQALKGGGNNFGVVTRVNLATVQTPGGVYGGLVTYPESSLEQLSDVVYDYHTRTAVEDRLTHVLPQYGFNGTTNETINFSPVVYNDLVSELPASMSGWVDTPHSNNTLRLTNYSSLAVEYNEGFPNGLVLVLSCPSIDVAKLMTTRSGKNNVRLQSMLIVNSSETSGGSTVCGSRNTANSRASTVCIATCPSHSTLLPKVLQRAEMP